MSVFGAPIPQEDHADRAVAAARVMTGRALAEFNHWVRDQDLGPGFRMGVGLNSGPVMSGNVGSARRLEYAAIGDTTNTASRLEQMTKGSPHVLYVSDATRSMLTRAVPDLIPVDELEVAGRRQRVAVWSIDTGGVPGDGPAMRRGADVDGEPSSVAERHA
jgi:adenylate cyclase